MWAPPSDPAGDPAGPMEKVCVVHKYKSARGALVALERTFLGRTGLGGCSWEMQCQFVQTLVTVPFQSTCVDAATQRHCSASQAVYACIATNRGRWLEIE